jgi:hypothetical protein
MRSRKIKRWLAGKVLAVLVLTQGMKTCGKVQVKRRSLLTLFYIMARVVSFMQRPFSLGEGTWHPLDGKLPGFKSGCQHALYEQTISGRVTWAWI